MKGTIKISVVAALLLLSVSGGLSAGDKVNSVVGTYLESEVNNSAYAAENLNIVPGISLGISGIDTPVYGKFKFENRMSPQYSVAGYTGQELREIFVFGGKIEQIKGYVFNPELEIRVKHYVGETFSEKGKVENRIHTNFLLPAGDNWALLVEAMPTLILSSAAGDISNNFYIEASAGTVWKIRPDSALRILLYTEDRVDRKTDSAGTINGGSVYQVNELQFRVSLAHRFPGGIGIGPFARIGLFRNEYSQDSGVVNKGNFNRQRFGLTLNYLSDGGFSPYFEGYYQYQAQDGAEPLNRMMWKIGFDYGIPGRSELARIRSLKASNEY